jgi:transposase InsO family protein
MAVARGGREAIWREEESERVIFHIDCGSTYTANTFSALCRRLGIRQSMGRVGCFDNAAAEAFFSSLEWEVLSRNTKSLGLRPMALPRARAGKTFPPRIGHVQNVAPSKMIS